MPWRPGQQPDRTLEAYYDDLPDHLREHVVSWLQGTLSTSFGLTTKIAMDRRIVVSPTNHGAALNQLMAHVQREDDQEVLNMVEDVLRLGGPAQTNPSVLTRTLTQGHSAYAVNDDRTGLEMRLHPEVKEQAQAVVDAAEEGVATHLTAAWNAAYGRTPDADKAYTRAIKAVEAALRPVISPTASGATLTRMINDMAAKPAKWSFAIADERPATARPAPGADGVEVVLDLMRLLAYGEKERHGTEGPVELHTAEEAQAAVMIAITLIQFVELGALVQVP